MHYAPPVPGPSPGRLRPARPRLTWRYSAASRRRRSSRRCSGTTFNDVAVVRDGGSGAEGMGWSPAATRGGGGDIEHTGAARFARPSLIYRPAAGRQAKPLGRVGRPAGRYAGHDWQAGRPTGRQVIRPAGRK